MDTPHSQSAPNMTDQADDHLSRRHILSALALSGTGVAAAFGDDALIASAKAAETGGQTQIDRAFVRIREGLVHYRSSGQRTDGKGPLPLYMVHGGPGSSRGLESVLLHLGHKRFAMAPDTLGYGDSVGPELETPEIAYYADSVLRILDAMDIEKIDFYGSHTGAHIGCELALRAPDRVRRLIFDGVTLFPPEERADFLANYAPAIEPDMYGRQLTWAWHFVRDMSLFFPHYNHTAEGRLPRGLNSAQGLHNSVVDVLKALKDYHRSYNAVFRHEFDKLLPQLKHEVLCITKESDPNIRYLEAATKLIKNAKKVAVGSPTDIAQVAAIMGDFLDA